MGFWNRRKRRSDDARDLSGKIVTIYDSNGQGGHFRDVRVVDLGFNSFVVGRPINLDASEDRATNPTVWTASTSIERMLVFDDLEEARRAFPSTPQANSPDGEQPQQRRPPTVKSE